MSQKPEKPILSGQRIKTRKRDEKEKYDPTGFRDFIVTGLNNAGSDTDAIWKFLDASGSKVDYRRYGETLFDILIAGGLLVPGGSVAQDGDKVCKTNVCIFESSDDMASLRHFEQIFIKLMRRFKYLEKIFYEEMKKILMFIRGFDDSQRVKLARMTALWISNGTVASQILTVLFNEHLVKDGTALNFLIEVFVTWKQEKGFHSLTSALKRGGLERRLMEFVPPNKRTDEYFKVLFDSKGLAEIVKLHMAQESENAKRDLEERLKELLDEDCPIKDIAIEIKKTALKYGIPEHELVVIIWTVLMSQVEWNKKEELLMDQALKHLKQYSTLLAAFATTEKSEYVLIQKVQEFCYENMNFMKVFHRIVVCFYKTDVLSEATVLRWYNEAHSSKGKLCFVQQMKKFVEWLQNAEEESDSSSDDDDEDADDKIK